MISARRFLRNHWGKALGLLAVAGILGLVWWALPVLPRLVLRPETCDGKRLSERLEAEEQPGYHCVYYHASLRFSPDGRWLLTSNADKFGNDWRRCVQVWHTGSGKEQTKLVYTDESAVRNVDFPEFQFSPDSRYLALGYHQDGEQTIDVLDLFTGRRRTFPALRFSFSTDGKQLAIVDRTADGLRQRLRIRDTATGEEIATVSQSTRPLDESTVDFWNLAFLGDGKTLVFTTYKPTRLVTRRYRPNALKSKIAVVLWDIPTRRTRHIICDAQESASSPDGKLMAVPLMRRSHTPPIQLWEIATARLLGNLQAERWVPMGELKFSADGSILTASSGIGGGGDYLPLDGIAAWDVPTRRLVSLHSRRSFSSIIKGINHFTDPNSSFLPRFALCWYDDGRGSIMEVNGGRECFALPEVDKASDQSFTSYALSPNQEFFALSEQRDRKQNATWEWLAKALPWLDTTPPTTERRIRCWNLASGREFPSLRACWDHFALSPDSRLLATYCDDGTIQIWDIPARKPLGWFLTLAGLLLLLSLGGFWWQARRRKREPALATEAIPCGT
jgi:WD40 repeat protein